MFEDIQRTPDVVMIEEKQALPADGRKGVFALADVAVETVQSAEGLSVHVTAQSTPVKKVRLRWRFEKRLKGQVLGDAWERSYGDLGWQHITPCQTLPWYALVNQGDVTAGYGVKVRPAAICSWQIDPEGVTLWLDVRCGGDGVRLNGRRLAAAQVVCREYGGIRPFEAAKKFCHVMCTDPLLPPAPVYGANNWYYAYGHSSREEVLADAEYLASLTEGLENRPYFVIDDCWQRDRYHADGTYEEIYNGGPWLPNGRFGDMAALAGQIREKGVLPGLWVRLLQDRNPEIPDGWRLPHNGGLDPSVPEALSFVKEAVERIGQWGFRLLKHDFSTFDLMNRWGCEMPYEMAEDGWHFADQSRTSAEIILSLYRAILDAAGKYDMLVLGCNTVGHLGAGLMHLHRTGDDTSGLMWERTLRFGVNTLAFRLPQHGAFYDIDADCIGISDKIPWEYNRQWGKLLSLSGTSLFYSVKPRTMPRSEEKEFARMLRDNALRREIAEPLDWQDTALPQDWVLDGRQVSFHWYEPWGLRVACATGPIWEKVWKEVSRDLSGRGEKA